MKSLRIMSLGCALLALPIAANASVSFYFAQKDTTTKITSLLIGDVGSTIDMTLCMQLSDPGTMVSAVDVFIGYDRTNAHNPSASIMDGKIGLAGTINASLSNYNVDLPSRLKGVGGGETKVGQDDSSIRPYGLDVSMSADPGTEVDFGTGAVKLFNLSLKNLGLQAGQSYNIVIWDAGQGFGDTTFTNNFSNTILRPGEAAGLLTLRTQAVPEPVTMVTLGLGIASVLTARRRRR